MNLDCIQTEYGNWKIIDHDNSCKVFAAGKDADAAWFHAANKLVDIVNKARDCLRT